MTLFYYSISAIMPYTMLGSFFILRAIKRIAKKLREEIERNDARHEVVNAWMDFVTCNGYETIPSTSKGGDLLPK